MNPAEFLTISSSVVPDHDALVSGDGKKRITYGEMASRVNRLASSMQSLGVGCGSKVAMMALNSPEYVEAYYACAKLGACFVPLNCRMKQEELVYMLNTSEASLVFIGDRYVNLLNAIKPKLTTVKDVVALESKIEGLPSYQDLLDSGVDEEIFADIDESDPTVLIFTSGTTALPKGVNLTYLNLSLYVMNTMSPADPSAEEEESTLLSVGIFHVAGVTAIMSSIWGGRKLVILPQFEPEAWLHAVQNERVTHAFVVPTMLKRIMESGIENYDLSSLKLITYGAAPMPYEVVRRAIDVFSCGLMNAYGQTESTSSLTYLGPDDHRLDGTHDENEKKLKRLRSVGRAMDDVEIAILDAQGRRLPSGSEGEICVQSARVMKEYIKQEDATASAIVEGWLHTGDVGYLDEDGYLFITGRVKDLIIRGGENISAGEIEAVVEGHPAVEEAAVIGVPDPDWGEVIKVIAVLKNAHRASIAELQAYCKERLASYKTPAYVTFVDELPRNPMGKVLKTELRKTHGGPDNS